MEGLTELLTYLTGFAASFLLGAAKKLAEKVDVKVNDLIKPFFPVIVAVLAVVLPFVGNLIGLVEIPTAEALANAPLATLIGVVARELLVKVRERLG